MHTLFKTFLACGVAAGVTGLTACSGGGSREEGYGAAVKAIAVASAPHAHDAHAGGDEHGELKRYRRNDGMVIELQLGLLNLAPVELIACPSTSAALGHLLKTLNPLGTAYAHSDHEGTPPAGPVSVVEADGTEFDLGSITAEPGSYCGLTVELMPAESGSLAKHGDLDTSLDGYAVNVAPCYYPGSVGKTDAEAEAETEYHCTQAKVGTTFRHFDLMFSAPVTVDNQHRTLDLTVVTRYEEWFDGVDMSLLEGDPTQQAKLMDNIVAATHVLTAEEQNVAVGFAIKVGGEQALCGKTYQSIGNGAQQDYQLNDFRYYISDVHLHGADGIAPLTLAKRADGTVYQSSEHNVALLGLVQGCAGGTPISTLSLAGSAKAGSYDELCFNVGLPYDLNHQDVATSPSPMNVTAMSWNWLGGHKFIRVDGVGDADSAAPKNFFLHLGSTGCSNGGTGGGAPPTQACSFPNLAEVCLDYAALQDGKRVIADVAPVYSESDITFNTPDTPPGCMSGNNDPECKTIMPKLGLDFTFNGNVIPSEGQQMFFVE